MDQEKQGNAVLEDLRTSIEAVAARALEGRAFLAAVDRCAAAATAARLQGHEEAVSATFMSAFDLPNVTDQGARAVLFAKMRENDSLLDTRLPPGMRCRRLTFTDGNCDDSDMDVRLRKTPTGALLPLASLGEVPLVTIAALGQLLLPGVKAPDVRDSAGLFGAAHREYAGGERTRLLWGATSCLLTDRRVVALFFDESAQTDGLTRERGLLPRASVEADGYGTVVVATIARSALRGREVMDAGLFGRRVPTVSLLGDVTLVLNTYGIFDADGRVSKPKNAIIDAIEQFINLGLAPLPSPLSQVPRASAARGHR